MVATTITAALTATAIDNLVAVASATGISSAGEYSNIVTHLMIDGEIMAVRSISSTNATVIRGVMGTPIQAHAAGASVLVLSAGEVPRPYIPGFADGSLLFRSLTSTIATAGAVTYTALQLLGGLIKRDPNGAGRSDVTPTAALLLAELAARIGGDVPIGLAFEFVIRNDADAAETITVTAGTGATLSGTMTIAQSNSKRFRVTVTGVGASAAYTVDSLGTVVH